jgi:hypothetical protein
LTKAVTSAVAKKLTSHAGIRLGGREERRQVYARFQAATVEAISFAQLTRMEKKLGPAIMGPRRVREWGLMTHERQVELLASYFEMRLVANPEPLDKGEAAASAASEVLESATARKQEEFSAGIEHAITAQREFTDVCRDDLWYLPQRWQVHRRATLWWKVRKQRRKEVES